MSLMSLMRLITPSAASPWFKARPRIALGVAGALFAAVVAAGASSISDHHDVSTLLVLPVALVALTVGLRLGLAAGLLGAVAGTLMSDLEPTSIDMLIRSMPIVLLGGLLGYASDRLRDGAARERRAAAALLLQREAAEINDRVVQELAVVKWRLEAGDADAALELLTDTIDTAQALVSEMLRSASPLTARSVAPLGVAVDAQ
jgi:hypothetical protein